MQRDENVDFSVMISSGGVKLRFFAKESMNYENCQKYPSTWHIYHGYECAWHSKQHFIPLFKSNDAHTRSSTQRIQQTNSMDQRHPGDFPISIWLRFYSTLHKQTVRTSIEKTGSLCNLVHSFDECNVILLSFSSLCVVCSVHTCVMCAFSFFFVIQIVTVSYIWLWFIPCFFVCEEYMD